MILFTLIRDWAEERNLISGSNSHAQMLKLTEEVGELAAGVARNNKDVIRDSIGDCIVVLTILAAQNGLDVNDCIIHSYSEIKNRKGKMVDGVFIKEENKGL
jgi:NTP pyrophosphatase (non-canonical NTP hydrolase)